MKTSFAHCAFCRMFALVILLTGLSACVGPQINYYQLSGLDKGMTVDNARSKLGQEPLSVHFATQGGFKYEFDRYNLNNGMIRDTYLLAFEDGRLKYWGYIDEFRRYPDKSLNNAIHDVLMEIRASSN